MDNFLKVFISHFLVVLGFVLISLSYFYPTLQGKKIYQHDIAEYTGMAREINEYRTKYQKETYWTNSSFLGMPTYQLGAKYPYNYVKQLDKLLRFLPRPADYLFLYLMCFYILGMVLTSDIKISLIGALAFGFSTYLIIIISAGHNSKAHAIAYMPLVLSGILLVFKKRYVVGVLLTTLALSLEISANHFQVTYYLLILAIILCLAYILDAFYKRKLLSFFKSSGLLFLAALFSVGLNATSILATKEYAEDTTRGKSEITINSDGTVRQNSTGLSKEYITVWSYGIAESFNLFIPRFMGGESRERLDKKSFSYKSLLKMGFSSREASNIVQERIPTYWGEQPGVAGPAYIGAIVIFLFCLALFLVKGRNKWWIIVVTVLTLLLSYGKNLNFLTNFFIDNIPLYSAFRAVSSIQIIVEFCVPIMVVLGLRKLFDDNVDKDMKLKALKYTTILFLGLLVFFLLFNNSLFNFVSEERYLLNKNAFGSELMNAIVKDRKGMFVADTKRSLILVALISSLIFLYLKRKFSKNILIISIITLIAFDLISVDWKYLNDSNFVSPNIVKQPFVKNLADVEILKDKGYFRVYDINSSFFSGKASYFHNSIGGYHAAQPKRVQDLYEFYISKGHIGILNMLNVKYFIQSDSGDNGKVKAFSNSTANGNAWFVKSVKLVSTSDEEILELKSIDTKNESVIRSDIWQNYASKEKNEMVYERGEMASIELLSHKSDHLVYSSNNRELGFGVFSENFYKPGWQAYIDGVEVDHLRVNYTLRGLLIPEGEHKIEFKFIPKVIDIGSKITIGSLILIVLLVVVLLYFKYNRSFNSPKLKTIKED